MTTTTTKDRKSIARQLDRCAARADMIDREPATSKQCWFLAGLLAERGHESDEIGCGILNTQAILTKRQASSWIDEYLQNKAKAEAAGLAA